MTEVKFDRVSWQRDREGVWLMLHTMHPGQAESVCEKFAEGKTYCAELKEFRKKRSLNANAYFWTLLDKISAVLGRGKEELSSTT